MNYRGGQRGSARSQKPADLGAILQNLGSRINNAYLEAADPEAAYTKRFFEQGTTAQPSGRNYQLGSERQGPYVPDNIVNAPRPPILPAPSGFGRSSAPGFGTTTIVRGGDDEYRQQLSQYGALAKAGKQEEAEKLGMEIWQQKYGKTPIGQPGGAIGTINPLMRSMFGDQTGEAPGQRQMAPDGQTMMGDLGSRLQGEGGYTMEAFNPTGFSGAANAVPAPWNTQGQAVSAPYTEAMSRAFDKTNPMNLISQQPIEMDNDVQARVQAFLAGRGK